MQMRLEPAARDHFQSAVFRVPSSECRGISFRTSPILPLLKIHRAMPSPPKTRPQTPGKDSSSSENSAHDDLGLGSNKIDRRRDTDDSSTRFEDPSEDILAAVPDVEVDLEKGEGTELKRTPSNVIPLNKRRGLFAQLVIGIPEIEDPVRYPYKTKTFIVFIIAFAAIAAPMGCLLANVWIKCRSAIYLPALPHVITGLNTNSTSVNLTVALYMLALGFFPLWWSAASERIGRRTIYVISFALWIVFNILCATSQSIVELIIMRVLAAGAGASVQAVGAGTLADIFIPQERGRAMGYFYIGPLTGPLIVCTPQLATDFRPPL